MNSVNLYSYEKKSEITDRVPVTTSSVHKAAYYLYLIGRIRSDNIHGVWLPMQRSVEDWVRIITSMRNNWPSFYEFLDTSPLHNFTLEWKAVYERFSTKFSNVKMYLQTKGALGEFGACIRFGDLNFWKSSKLPLTICSAK